MFAGLFTVRTGSQRQDTQERGKVCWCSSYQQTPCSLGILPLLRFQPASSCAPAFIFPAKRAEGKRPEDFKPSASRSLSCSLPVALRSRISPTVSQGEAGASGIHCRALRRREAESVNHTGSLGNWRSPHHGRRWLVGPSREPEVTSHHRWGLPRDALGSRGEPNERCSTCELSSSPLTLTSEPRCFILQLLSNRLSGVDVAGMAKRKWERGERSSSPQLALLLFGCQKCR